MVLNEEVILRKVKVAMDMNVGGDLYVTEGDLDTLSVDEIIRSKMLEGVRRVEMEAPAYMLESGHNFGEEIFRREDGSGWTMLPEDFGRLIKFRMSDWERSVTRAISEEDPEYEKQRSRYKGIRGTPQKPVCVISVRPEGMVLEYYSSRDKNSTVVEGVYLPRPGIDENGGIDISERCEEAIIYMIAGLAWGALGEMEKMKVNIELSKTAMI